MVKMCGYFNVALFCQVFQGKRSFRHFQTSYSKVSPHFNGAIVWTQLFLVEGFLRFASSFGVKNSLRCNFKFISLDVTKIQ